jgi:hypothetical protein
MTWNFGDSFDLYATTADMVTGYWDSAVSIASFILAAGRFTGSRAISCGGAGNLSLTKSSGTNDAVHHLVVAFDQTAAISGTGGAYFQLSDGATAQCTIQFQANGNIVLIAGAVTGSVLDTYSGAFSAQNTWYGFEIEVVINNTTGSWAVRKNGNNVNDHSASGLNTRASSNNYANKLTYGTGASGANSQIFDDLYWQSGSSTGTWLGDLRCYTRMPASDNSVQFTPNTYSLTPYTAFNTANVTAGIARYSPFIPLVNGTLGSLSLQMSLGYTGNLKCSIFADNAGVPGAVLGSANVLVNPATGANTITFGTPVALTQGTQYWLGTDPDVTSGTFTQSGGSNAKTTTPPSTRRRRTGSPPTSTTAIPATPTSTGSPRRDWRSPPSPSSPAATCRSPTPGRAPLRRS